MEARVFLEEEFFEALDKFEPQTGLGVIDTKSENKNQLLKILEHSEINSPLQEKYFINLHKKLSQNYNADNWKDLSLFRAFRNGKLKLKEIDLEAANSVFLLNKTTSETSTVREEKNIISLGKNYDFLTSPSPRSFGSKSVDEQMQGIECIRHRCRNVILIDPYIFVDHDNLEPKIPNLITFLKELFIDNAQSLCFLSIITTNEDNNNKFNSKITEISDGMNNANLNISVYGHSKGLFNSNRHVITDYSIMDYQHLFDRKASVSVSFLYDGEISNNFLRVQELKQQIIRNYNKDPEKMGIYIRKFGDILENNLLK